MPSPNRDFERNDRLTGAIRSVLSELLLQEVNDPRLEGVVISGVSINRDRTQAEVFFSVVGDEERERRAADGFAAAASFLRREMGRRMHIRTVPTLDFKRDRSFAYGDHMERVFDRLHEGDEADGSGSEQP
jgi:ribosome-binding factor A